jgi:sortase A
VRASIRIAGTLMILAGTGALAWALLVWQWQDPFTALYTRWEQRELASSFERRLHDTPRLLASQPTASPDLLARAARDWKRSSRRGDAVARLRIPRLGLDAVVVNGTDHDSLKRGPGRYLDTAMPGQGELVYIAGHRTTYGAPFSRLDRLRKGDRIELELPYATFVYRVTGQRVVPATATDVLRSQGFEQLALQACHPRFFASHRLLAYAKPIQVLPRSGPATAAAAAAAG